MDRRAFLAMFLGSSLAAPRAVAAQPAGRVYRIGVLTERTRDSVYEERVQAAFQRQGYVEGQNAAFEFQWAAERFEMLPSLAEELVRLKVDIIMTGSTPPAVAAKRATTTIPIVTVSSDPIGAGLVASLSRPGSNVTGVFLPQVDLAAKRLQLLREMVPNLNVVTIVWNPLNEAAHSQFKATEIAARTLGVTAHSAEMRRRGDLEEVFRSIASARSRGFVVMQDPVTLNAATPLAEYAAKYRLPGSHAYRTFAESGGLMSYGNNLLDTFEASAAYAHKMLRGARPADLPMEQPTKFELVINLKTARAIGLILPQSLVQRADEVIR